MVYIFPCKDTFFKEKGKEYALKTMTYALIFLRFSTQGGKYANSTRHIATYKPAIRHKFRGVGRRKNDVPNFLNLMPKNLK